MLINEKLLLANYDDLRHVGVKVSVSFINQIEKGFSEIIMFNDELTSQDSKIFIIVINKWDCVGVSYVSPVAYINASSRQQYVLLANLVDCDFRGFTIKFDEIVLNLDSA